MRKKTNYQLLKALVESLKHDNVASAILRQQILEVCEDKTLEVINNPKQYERHIIAPQVYVDLLNLVNKTIGYENN